MLYPYKELAPFWGLPTEIQPLKEQNPANAIALDELWRHYAKWYTPHTERHILYDSMYVRNLQSSNS